MSGLYNKQSKNMLYKGVWYDSINEARWAAMLDILGFVYKIPKKTNDWLPDFGFRSECNKIVYLEVKPYCARHGWPEPSCKWLNKAIRDKISGSVDYDICDEVIIVGSLNRNHDDIDLVCQRDPNEPAILGLRLKPTKTETGSENTDYWEPVYISIDRHGQYIYQNREQFKIRAKSGEVVRNPLTHGKLLEMWDDTYHMIGGDKANSAVKKVYDFNVYRKLPKKFK